MRQFMSLLALVAAVLFAPAASAAVAPSLAGRTFEVELKKPDGTTDKDTIVFTAAEADSIACHQYGFGKGPATYTAAGEATSFTFNTKNEKGGTMAWQGTVKGSNIEGSTVATMDGKPMTMTFKGQEAKGDKKDEKKDMTK